MSTNHVTVISEWLPTENRAQALFELFHTLAETTLKEEPGCLKYQVTRQVAHPGATGESKYTICLIQEYSSVEAFDNHCNSDYVKSFAHKHLEEMVKDWRCRMFSTEA